MADSGYDLTMSSVNELSPALAAHQESINHPPAQAPAPAPHLEVDEASSTDEMTRVELYEIAQELNIKGRSSMDRDELAEAVEAARAES